MARSAAQVMTETDPGPDLPPGAQVPVQHDPGLTGEGGIANINTGPYQQRPQQSRQQEPAEEFIAVETDNNFNPVGQPQAAQTQPAQPLADGGEVEDPAAGQQLEQNPSRESRAARNAKRREAREVDHATIRALQAQVAQLSEALGGVDQRFGRYDETQRQAGIAEIDRRINEAAAYANRAYDAMSQAMVSQDPDAFKRAMTERDKAIMAGQQLTIQKNILVRGAPQGQPQQTQQPQRQAAPPMPAAAQQYINEFVARHDWYRGPEATDRDSRRVNMIDAEVLADGFDPRTQDYWDELDDRLRDVLPHRFNDGQQQTQQPTRQQAQRPAQPAPQRRGPMVAGPSDRGPVAPKGTVYISPQRKDAMIKAGVLDSDGTIIDRTRHQRYLRQYAQFDRDNGAARS